MGNYIINDKRVQTMRAKLGDVQNLVDSDAFLPMFRSRQKKYGDKMLRLSAKIARSKRNPSRYFAKMWAKTNIGKTLEVLGDLIAKMKSRDAEISDSFDRLSRDDTVNYANIAIYNKMKAQFGLSL